VKQKETRTYMLFCR